MIIIKNSSDCKIASGLLDKHEIDYIDTSSIKGLFYDDIAKIVLQCVSKIMNIPIVDIKSEGKKGEIPIARHMARYFMKENTKMNLTDIAFFTGGKEHSAVIYSCKTILDIIETDSVYRDKFNCIEALIKKEILYKNGINNPHDYMMYEIFNIIKTKETKDEIMEALEDYAYELNIGNDED